MLDTHILTTRSRRECIRTLLVVRGLSNVMPEELPLKPRLSESKNLIFMWKNYEMWQFKEFETISLIKLFKMKMSKIINSLYSRPQNYTDM